MSNNDLRTALNPNASNNPIVTVTHYFERHKKQLEMALPKHLNADRMTRLALTAMSQNKQLASCDAKSLFGSVILASQLGLEIGVLGQGYLVPYKGKATFVPGWQGLVDLVSRSGRGTVYTGAIFKDQKFTFTDGARRDLVVENPTDLDDANDITHTFAVGWVKDAVMPIIELWSIAKIRKHRDKYNKVGSSHYSFAHWEMYARKIPLMQVLKYMPKSIELSNAIMADYAYDQGKTPIIEGEFLHVADDEAPAQSAKGTGTDFNFIATSIAACDTVDQLNEAVDLIRDADVSDEKSLELHALAELRAADIAKK
jgi:recombination protein RecT